MSRTLLSSALVGLLAAPVFAWAGSSIEGSMINHQVRPIITEKGMANLEDARFNCLNSDSDKPCVWVDPSADISGSFKITERKQDAEGHQCRTYTHSLLTRRGAPIRSERTGKGMVFKSTVCFVSGRWQRVDNVPAEPTTTPPANTNTSSSDTLPAPPPSGPSGSEHRGQYPNMTEPRTLGQILDGIKLYKQYLDAEKNEIVRSGLRDQMYGWIGSIQEQMTSLNKTMALDQLTVLLESIDTDAAKIKVIEILKPRLVLIGDTTAQKTDINNILQLLQKKQSRNRVRDQLKQLPTAAAAAVSNG